MSYVEQHLDSAGAPRSPGYAATSQAHAFADPKAWSVTHEVFGIELVAKDAAGAERMVAHDSKRAFGAAIPPI